MNRRVTSCWALALVAVALVFAGSASAQSAGIPAGQLTVTLPTWQDAYAWGAADGYFGWDRNADPAAYGSAQGLAAIAGLWLWPIGGQQYRPGGAEWSFTAPGTTRIASAQLDLAYRTKLFSQHCLDVGLRTGSEIRDQRIDCKPPHPPASEASYDVALSDPASEPTAKQAFFSTVLPVCKNPADTPCSKNIPPQDPVKNGAFARLSSVQLVLVDDDLPQPTASGPFRAIDGPEDFDEYINGSQSYDLTVTATDAGAGVSRTAVEEIGGSELAGKDAPCDPHHNTAALGSAICPASDSETLTVDTRPLSEGTHSFRATATDPAGNLGRSAPWTVRIDRTAPAAPTEPEIDAEGGGFDLDWEDATDPDLADGTPGSGVATFRVRYRVGGGDWAGWQEQPVDDPWTFSAEIGAPDGSHVEAQIVAVDEVGNVSQPAVVAADMEPDVVPEEASFDGELAAFAPIGIGDLASPFAATLSPSSSSSDFDTDGSVENELWWNPEAGTLGMFGVWTTSDGGRNPQTQVRHLLYRQDPDGDQLVFDAFRQDPDDPSAGDTPCFNAQQCGNEAESGQLGDGTYVLRTIAYVSREGEPLHFAHDAWSEPVTIVSDSLTVDPGDEPLDSDPDADLPDGPVAFPASCPKGKPNVGKDQTDLPICRAGTHGVKDIGGKRYSIRHHPTRLATKDTVNATDSLGNVIATLKSTFLPRNRDGKKGTWLVHFPGDGTKVNLGLLDHSHGTSRPRLEVQGFGCYKGGKPGRHVLVAFDGGRSQYSFRAFLPRSAVPDVKAALLRSHSTGCRASAPPRGVTPTTFSALKDPDLSGHYVGSDGNRHRGYATYNERLIGKSKSSSAGIYMVVNTTDVQGGGIVDALIPLDAGFIRYDCFNYDDPNSTGFPMRWSYGKVRGFAIWGWIPTDALPGAKGGC